MYSYTSQVGAPTVPSPAHQPRPPPQPKDCTLQHRPPQPLSAEQGIHEVTHSKCHITEVCGGRVDVAFFRGQFAVRFLHGRIHCWINSPPRLGRGPIQSRPRARSLRAVLKRKKQEGFGTPTETNVHRDALCFMVMGPSLLLYFKGWPLVAVGGWRLVVGSPWGPSLTKKNLGS